MIYYRKTLDSYDAIAIQVTEENLPEILTLCVRARRSFVVKLSYVEGKFYEILVPGKNSGSYYAMRGKWLFLDNDQNGFDIHLDEPRPIGYQQTAIK